MSQIFEALTVARDQAVERIRSLPATREEVAQISSGAWQGRDLPANLSVNGSNQSAELLLRGKLASSNRKIRNYLLLAFFGIGLVLLGTNYAFRSDGGVFPGGQQIYGVAFEGTVHPANEIRITSSLAGTVSTLFVKVGDRVKKGEQLLRMDDREAELSLEQARAELRSAGANLDNFRLQLLPRTFHQPPVVLTSETSLIG